MNRNEKITRFITKEAKGLEIGAFHSGVVPKRDGYNSRLLDVFDTETLRNRAHVDPTISAELEARIEVVDFVGSSTDIVNSVGDERFAYIVSSHNIEHCPDPITFFQGCSKVLNPDGVLSMIVPDRRGCYDYFRPNSTTADLIDAHFSKRTRPTYAQVFEQQSLAANLIVGDELQFAFPQNTAPEALVPFRGLQLYFDRWKNAYAEQDETYIDTHCWVFTPSIFELIIRDLAFLGLVDLHILEIESGDGEFFVHLRNSNNEKMSEDTFYRKRRELLLQANDELGSTSPRVRQIVEDALAAETARANRLQFEIDALRGSTSWKATVPLRAIRRFW